MHIPVQPEDVSTPLSNLFDDLRGGFADGEVSSELQDPLESWSTRMESAPVGISDTVQPDEQNEGTAVDIPGQERLPEDAADPALFVALRGANSTWFPATDTLSDLSQNSQAHAPGALVHATEFPPSEPEVDVACSDTSPFEEEACVREPQLADEEGRDSAGLTEVERVLVAQDPISEVLCDVQLIDNRERNNASPTMLESFLAEQEDTSRAALEISTIAVPSKGSTGDRAHSSRSADTTDAADTEGSDGEGPPVTRRRRRTRPHTRGSHNPSPPLTPRSSAHSVDVESTTALHRRKRLGGRKGMRRDSRTPETDDTSTSSTTSVSNKGSGERWPVQCFVERTTIGSQEVITIQMPALDLCAKSGRVSALSAWSKTSQQTPTLGIARGGRRRARFSPAEEDLLVELKERREPKPSWREIQRHFPQRTMGSLQVHYSTQLKVRRP